MKLELILMKYVNEEVTSPNIQTKTIETLTNNIELPIAYKIEIEWRVICLAWYNIILRMSWIEQYNLELDCRKIIKSNSWKILRMLWMEQYKLELDLKIKSNSWKSIDSIRYWNINLSLFLMDRSFLSKFCMDIETNKIYY